MKFVLKAGCLAGLTFAATAMAQLTAQEAAPAAAPQSAPQSAPATTATLEMTTPHVTSVTVDWGAVRAALSNLAPLTAGPGSPSGRSDAVARLNAATQGIFPGIATSPIPVLLPFDIAAFLRDRAAGAATDRSKYLPGYSPSNFFFYPGPGGYDAALTLQPPDAAAADVNSKRRIEVQISASAVIYELDGPALPEGRPVPELDGQFPGIRRLTLENHSRYTFLRFGVPYVVTIMCHRVRCQNADKIGIAFLKSLAVVGGAPDEQTSVPAAAPQAADAKAAAAPPTIDRPMRTSADFTYFAPGDLLPGTGMHGQSGRADTTVYANIRFPMARAPAFVNSQTFGNWGDCDFTGRVALGGHGKDAAYRCRVNSIPLVRDEAKNYAYPWRDNFCEHRSFAVSQCPAAQGHQGEDIRPGSCKLRNAEAERCEPYQDGVVAVRDGMVLRSPGDEALYLVVNAPGEHIRFRYLHMNPLLLDAAGLVNGRPLAAGEVIGAVDDYERYQGGTTYHLHFDVQVPTRDGWVFVNPYMTLVAAYERLIGARGKVVDDSMFASAPAAAAATPVADQAAGAPGPAAGGGVPNSAAIAASNPPADGIDRTKIDDERVTATGEKVRERRADSAERCETRVVKGHRRRRCRIAAAEHRHERERRADDVRSVDRRLSRQSDRARRHGRDLHPRHARDKARHHRA